MMGYQRWTEGSSGRAKCKNLEEQREKNKVWLWVTCWETQCVLEQVSTIHENVWISNKKKKSKEPTLEAATHGELLHFHCLWEQIKGFPGSRWIFPHRISTLSFPRLAPPRVRDGWRDRDQGWMKERERELKMQAVGGGEKERDWKMER